MLGRHTGAGHTEPYWALLGPTEPYWALLSPNQLYWYRSILEQTGPYGATLGPSEEPWEALGAIWRLPGTLLEQISGPLEALLETSWTNSSHINT